MFPLKTIIGYFELSWLAGRLTGSELRLACEYLVW